MSDKVYSVLGQFKSEGTINEKKLYAFLDDKNVPNYIKREVEDMQELVFESEKGFMKELAERVGEEKARKFKNKSLNVLSWKGDASTILVYPDHAITRLYQHMFGKELVIDIEIYHTLRSAAQNRYLHGVVVPTIAGWAYDTVGIRYTKDEIKQFLYEHILKNRNVIKQVLGVEVNVNSYKRFSEMNKKEFTDNVEYVRGYFAEKGCHIPEATIDSFIADYVKKKFRRGR
jgi:hypothetical protein